MNKNFIAAVEAKDLVSVRVFLSNELMLDPRGASFDKMLQYARANLEGLFEPDDGVSYPEDPEKWDENLLFAVKNDLDANFSRERLAFYAKMAPVVLKEKCEKMDEDDARKAAEDAVCRQKQDDKEEGRILSGMDNDELFPKSAVIGGALTILGHYTKGVISGVSTTVGVAGLAASVGYCIYKILKK